MKQTKKQRQEKKRFLREMVNEMIQKEFPQDYELLINIWKKTKNMYNNYKISQINDLVKKIALFYEKDLSLINKGHGMKGTKFSIGERVLQEEKEEIGAFFEHKLISPREIIAAYFDLKRSKYIIKKVYEYIRPCQETVKITENGKELLNYLNWCELFISKDHVGLFKHAALGGVLLGDSLKVGNKILEASLFPVGIPHTYYDYCFFELTEKEKKTKLKEDWMRFKYNQLATLQ